MHGWSKVLLCSDLRCFCQCRSHCPTAGTGWTVRRCNNRQLFIKRVPDIPSPVTHGRSTLPLSFDIRYRHIPFRMISKEYFQYAFHLIRVGQWWICIVKNKHIELVFDILKVNFRPVTVHYIIAFLNTGLFGIVSKPVDVIAQNGFWS